MRAVHVATDDAFLRYVEIPGEDPPLVWLHGWQCSSTGELLPAAVAPPLRGRRSLLVDFLGHGYSDRPRDFGYRLEDHARTIVSLIDQLDLVGCGIVGHSMGGGVGAHAAAARPDRVSMLIMAEGVIDGGGDVPLDGLSEEQFLDRGYADLLEARAEAARMNPAGVPAAHLGITRTVDARALHREAVSMAEGTTPPIRSLLSALAIPRWYLMGAESEPEPELERDLGAMGIGWKVVAKTGHPMGLQNPEGFAQAVAEAATEAWG